MYAKSIVVLLMSGTNLHEVLGKVREDYDLGIITLDEKIEALSVMRQFLEED